MQILEQRQGAVLVLRPQGPLIQADAAAFRDRMLDVMGPSMGRVIIDASAIPYVDSLGLEALLDVAEEMSAGGQVLRLCGVNDTVREVMELTDIASHFEHFEDMVAAVKSFT